MNRSWKSRWVRTKVGVIILLSFIGSVYLFHRKNQEGKKPLNSALIITDEAVLGGLSKIPDGSLENEHSKNVKTPQGKKLKLVKVWENGARVYQTDVGQISILPDGRILILPDEL